MFAAGKLMAYRRKRNDASLIFCLRHYGEDAAGRRVTVDYISARASSAAGAAAPPPRSAGAVPLPEQARGGAAAEASATAVRAVIAGPRGSGADLGRAAGTLDGFEGVRLDRRAEAEIAQALEGCAARARAADDAQEAARDAAAEDPEVDFVPVGPGAWRFAARCYRRWRRRSSCRSSTGRTRGGWRGLRCRRTARRRWRGWRERRRAGRRGLRGTESRDVGWDRLSTSSGRPAGRAGMLSSRKDPFAGANAPLRSGSSA